MKYKKRLETLFEGRTTDRRRAWFSNRVSTGSMQLHQRGEIGSRIAFISTYWSGGNAILTPFALGVELARIGFSVVIIATSDQRPDFGAIVKRLEVMGLPVSTFTIMSRANIGKDFGGYKDAFHYFQAEIAQAEHVFLGNDSLVGPLFPSDYFQRLCDAPSGVWAPTESFDRSYHLQSSHLLFAGREAIDLAQGFFRKYKFYRNRDNIIRFGEIGISQWCLRQSCLMGAFYPLGLLAEKKKTDVVKGEKKDFWLDVNSQHFYFDTLLDERFPFVKRELLTTNPMQFHDVYSRVFSRMAELDQPSDFLFHHFRPI